MSIPVRRIRGGRYEGGLLRQLLEVSVSTKGCTCVECSEEERKEEGNAQNKPFDGDTLL